MRTTWTAKRNKKQFYSNEHCLLICQGSRKKSSAVFMQDTQPAENESSCLLLQLPTAASLQRCKLVGGHMHV
eukprot:5723998-Amphidinium_carterae.1